MTIHARENFWNTPWSLWVITLGVHLTNVFLQWFSNQILWRDPVRRYWAYRSVFGFHLGSDWQFGIENKLLVPRRWNLKCWLQNSSERSQNFVEAGKTLGLKVTPIKCQFVSLVTPLKNDDRQFSIFPKNLPNSNETCCYQSTGIVAGMVFPSFFADHRCVPSPPNMMTHMKLDWWRTSMISLVHKKVIG